LGRHHRVSRKKGIYMIYTLKNYSVYNVENRLGARVEVETSGNKVIDKVTVGNLNQSNGEKWVNL
jgi:hypothetical protein